MAPATELAMTGAEGVLHRALPQRKTQPSATRQAREMLRVMAQ